jgi:hypothetical protein
MHGTRRRRDERFVRSATPPAFIPRRHVIGRAATVAQLDFDATARRLEEFSLKMNRIVRMATTGAVAAMLATCGGGGMAAVAGTARPAPSAVPAERRAGSAGQRYRRPALDRRRHARVFDRARERVETKLRRVSDFLLRGLLRSSLAGCDARLVAKRCLCGVRNGSCQEPLLHRRASASETLSSAEAATTH